MTNDNPTPNESIDSRTVRALVEPLTVLSHDETPIDAGDDAEVIHDETGRVDDTDETDDTDDDTDAVEPSPLAERIAEVAPFARDE